MVLETKNDLSPIGQAPRMSGIALLDRRIALAGDIWDFYNQVPVLNADSSREDLYRDQLALYGIVLRYLVETGNENLFPKMEGALRNETEMAQAGIRPFQRSLHLDDTANSFELRVIEGVITANRHRESLQYFIDQFGDNWLDPEKYMGIIPHRYQQLLEVTHEIIPARFSLNFVVEDEAFADYYQRTERTKKVSGFHPDNSVINFMRALPFSYRETSKNKVALEERIDEVVNHEDFHAFTDGFFRRDISPVFGRRHEAIDDALMMAKEINKSPDLQYPRQDRNLEKALMQSMDGDLYEFGAEFVSLTSGKFPKRTFARLMNNKYRRLRRAAPVGSLARSIVNQKSQFFKLGAFQAMVDQYLSLTEDLPQREAGKVLAALAVLPPSRWVFIPRLIKYWQRSS